MIGTKQTMAWQYLNTEALTEQTHTMLKKGIHRNENIVRVEYFKI